MNINAMPVRKDMRSYVEAAMAIGRDQSHEEAPSAILSSISFSTMLENALKIELLKEQHSARRI